MLLDLEGLFCLNRFQPTKIVLAELHNNCYDVICFEFIRFHKLKILNFHSVGNINLKISSPNQHYLTFNKDP